MFHVTSSNLSQIISFKVRLPFFAFFVAMQWKKVNFEQICPSVLNGQVLIY